MANSNGAAKKVREFDFPVNLKVPGKARRVTVEFRDLKSLRDEIDKVLQSVREAQQ